MTNAPEARLAVVRPVPQPSTSTRGLGREPRSTSQEMRRADWMYCPGSVTGHNEGSRRDGRCTWCGYRFIGPAPRPRLGASYQTELDQEYRRTYDPDWGTDPLDV